MSGQPAFDNEVWTTETIAMRWQLWVMSAVFAMSATSSGLPPTPERLRQRSESTSQVPSVAHRRRRGPRAQGHSTSSCSGPTTRIRAGEPSTGRNTCTTPSSAHLLQRLLELLGLQRVGEALAADDFRRKAWHADEVQRLALRQRVADAQGRLARRSSPDRCTSGSECRPNSTTS
jgi:hypothetical protein